MRTRIQERTRVLTATMLFLCAPAARLAAQEPESACGVCRAALQQSLHVETMTEEEALAFLDILDEQTWTNLEWSADTAAKFPIKGIPFEGKGDFKRIDTARTLVFRARGFTRDSARSRAIIDKRIQDRGFDSFDKCIALCSARRPGLSGWIQDVSQESLRAVVAYVGLPEGPHQFSIDYSDLSGGSVAGAPKGKLFSGKKTLSSNGTIPFTITREPRGAQVLVSVGREGQSVVNLTQRKTSDGDFEECPEDGDTPAPGLVCAPPMIVQTAGQVSDKTGTGVGNLNLKFVCSQDGPVGFICSDDENEKTRAVYRLPKSMRIRKGAYRLQIEYASAEKIDGVALHVNGQATSLDFPATGGPGMDSRRYVDTEVSLEDGENELIVDRGRRIPHLRGFILTRIRSGSAAAAPKRATDTGRAN